MPRLIARAAARALGILLLAAVLAAPTAYAAPLITHIPIGNGSLSVAIILANAPDLVVDRIVFHRSRTTPGYELEIRVRNQGNDLAGPFAVQNVSGNNSSTQWVAGLPAGSATTRVFQVRPCGSQGAVNGFLFVDVNKQVQEFNEGNNLESWSITCRDHRGGQ